MDYQEAKRVRGFSGNLEGDSHFLESMSQFKIAANIIVKDDNEAEKLERCLKTVAPNVDGLFIQVNNTPNEKIQALCRKYGASLDVRPGEFRYKVTKEEIKWLEKFLGWKPFLKEGDEIFNFGEARQALLDKTPDSYQWLFWIDADDILRDGDLLHQIANEAQSQGFEAVFFNYLYQVESQYGKMIFNEFINPVTVEGERITNVVIQHLRERLVRIDGDYRKVFKWIGSIHETLIQQRETKKIEDQRASVLHLSSIEKFKESIQRNMKVLETDIIKTKGTDPRPIYYLGKAFYDLQTPESRNQAEKLITMYLSPDEHKNNMSGWPEERCQAWEYLAEINRARGEVNKSIKALLMAIYEYPQFPSTYLSMAMSYMMKQDWDRVRFWALLASKIPSGKSTLVSNPRDDEMRLHTALYQSALQTGRSDEAFESAKKLKELLPNDPNIDQQWQFINSIMAQKSLFTGYMDLVQYLNGTGQSQKIKPLLLAAPEEIANNPAIVKLFQQVYPPKDWGSDEIALYCGQQFTLWGPETLKNPGSSFVGGSEEAVIHAAEALAKKGWKVTVYGDPPEDQQKEINGVIWKSYFEFNPQDKFNILIYWRAVSYTDMQAQAKKTYLWCHDVLNPLEFTQERLDRITKIIVLSDTHRQTIPEVPDEKFIISSNGFVEYLPELKPENNPKWCIYTSSYDRGLENLLTIWPEVIKEIPDAQLHIFYGWQLFQTFYKQNPERMAWMDKMNDLMTQQGITHHNRVPQPELEEWYKKCGLFTYPSHFREINCISAFKAQAFGSVPVVTDFAALRTTVQSGTKTEGEIHENVCLSPEAKETYKNALIFALKSKNMQETERAKGIEYAKQFTWENITYTWDKDFKEVKE